MSQILSLREIPPLDRLAYVSIGGGEGAELFWVLKNTEVPFGVLVEMNANACEAARLAAGTLTPGKQGTVIEGDVTQKIQELQTVLQKAKEEDLIDGVLISAHAVFHELPYRGHSYEMKDFLKGLFGSLDSLIFVTREPCRAFNWPARVQMRLRSVASDLLYQFVQDINTKLGFASAVHVDRDGFVEMSSELATETLHKLFYIEDYAYEIQEKLTGIDPDNFVLVVEELLGKNSAFQVRLNSASFSRKHQELGIEARTLEGNSLSMPLSFFNIVAQKQST